ncbi:MAG TPA: cupin domain-containing protein [Thermoanaerobaculia bacterium]|nr:cupin domain-containing protein [Thermoanaerobaculia bacterium]
MHPVDRTAAEHYTWGNGCDGWHLVRDEKLSIIEERMPPGTSEVMHLHQHARQFFYILSGVATFVVDGKEIHVKPRQGVHIPAGVPHRILNASAETLEFMVISQPPSHGDRVAVAG